MAVDPMPPKAFDISGSQEWTERVRGLRSVPLLTVLARSDESTDRQPNTGLLSYHPSRGDA